MDWLEQELRDALNRKDPSPDFAERVRWSLHVQKHRAGARLAVVAGYRCRIRDRRRRRGNRVPPAPG